MKASKGWHGLVLVISFVGMGCAFEGGTPEDAGAESLREVSSALFVNEACPAGEECFDRTDSSGSIKMRVYRGPWSAASGTPTARCSVGSAFTMVGGGIEVEGSPHPGHLLVRSSRENANTWLVESKHHVYPQDNRIRAYAIGIQLDNLSKAKLQPQIKARQVSSPGNEAFPGVGTGVPANEVLLSAGVSANGGLNGQLLTKSFPVSSNGWVALSKEHSVPAPGNIVVTVLSMPVCPTGFTSNPFCVTGGLFSADGSSGFGYRSANAVIADNTWIVTGVGAESASPNNMTTNGGRPLTDMFPTTTGLGATASSKDHQFSDSSFTRAFVRVIKRL
jgi:hypothetical protein